MFNYMSRPKKLLEFYPNPKMSPLGSQKVENDHQNSPLELEKVKNGPKIKSHSKVRIKGIIGCWTKWVDPKTIFEP